MSSPAKTQPDMQLATKVGYRLSRAIRIGIESYNGLGTVNDFGWLAGNDQATFVAIDTRISRWDLNPGLGKGYGSNRDNTIVKLVIGVPIGK